MSLPLEVTYSETELTALVDAHKIVSRLRLDLTACAPAWTKLEHIGNYISRRQKEEVAEALSDPAWCYYCDRPKSDCACHLDPNGLPQERAA